MNNITFAYFIEAIKAIDIDNFYEEYTIGTIPTKANMILIDLDNKKIIIGGENVA